MPPTPAEIAALLGAIALYGARHARARRALAAAAASTRAPRRARATRYALNVVGYMGNNVLPARAGDAIRVVLMAPRADTSKRTRRRHAAWPSGCSTSPCSLVLFVVVGYGLLGEVGGDTVELIVLVAIVGGRGGAAVGDAARAPQRAPARLRRADRRRPRSACAARTTGCGCWP